MLPKYLIIKYFSYLHNRSRMQLRQCNARVSAGWGSSYLVWAGRLSAQDWQISIISILSILSTDDGSILHIPQNRGDWVKYGDKYFSSTRYIKMLRVGWHPCLVWTRHQFKLGEKNIVSQHYIEKLLRTLIQHSPKCVVSDLELLCLNSMLIYPLLLPSPLISGLMLFPSPLSLATVASKL